jgi:secreted PhoX family phosphatase
MTDLILSRRAATLGLTATAFAGFARIPTADATAAAPGYGPLVSDPAGLIDLPRGFSYRILSTYGDRMDDGWIVPDNADGMGCIPLPGGRHALVRNHELAPGDRARGAFGGTLVAGPAFDQRDGAYTLPGSTTTLVIDNASGRVVSQHLSLAGTIRNCAGGTTPWGSWLTCEEDVTRAGNGLSRDHGWVFEVPAAARGRVDPQPLTAMGRFNHEAVAVDPRTGIVYLTEDRDDSLLYRFLPDRPGRLAAGGRLQAMAARDPAITDTRNWKGTTLRPNEWLPTRWIDLDHVDSPDDDLRRRGAAAGALTFARGEGIHMGRGELYFCCTSGGAAQLGQIMRYRPAPDEGQRGEGGMVQIFVESTGKPMLDFGDNLVVAPNGHLVVCEDQYTDIVANRLIGVTPMGQTYVLGFLRTQTELAGACFSPDGRTMYVNAYSPGRTLAIRGPWLGA